MRDRLYWLWLAGVKSIGNQKKQALLRFFKEPEAIFRADKQTLCQVRGIGEKSAAMLIKEQSLAMAEKADKYIEKYQIVFVTQNDKDYPERFKNIYNPPVTFFAKGDLSLMHRDLTIGIIGSRNASPGGMNKAEKFARILGESGFTIVSGLAAGIDGKSHQGALDTVGSTIAVMGTGINRCYPAENKHLYHNILEKGLIITEFFLDEKPLPYHFPLRNRLISGLSEGVLVVEAGEKSGALITAGHALEQGKNVYAIPGEITMYQSAGSNRLLKEGAKLVTDLCDILEDFVYIKEQKKKKYPVSSDREVSPEEAYLLKMIRQGYNEIETLVHASELTPQQLNALLSEMELEDLVRIEFGKIYLL